MSAIAFIINWDGHPVSLALLQAVNACVYYRCPDGAWTWSDGPVGLAQADLATLPEDTPGIPSVRQHLRIVADCRLDNRADLRRALPAGALPADGPDAAYILAAYEAWGEACVGRLLGDFAFAIWDGRARHVFAARDCSGVRQLFYSHRYQTLFVASDRTQLLQDTSLALDVDDTQVIEYLTPSYQYSGGWDQGMLRHVHVLPAGHVLWADERHTTVRPFWTWEEQAPARTSEVQVLEAYRQILTEAVRCRLRSRTPRVAMELSGGLDSPAVACLAAQLKNDMPVELHTLSMVFDEVPAVDERQRIYPVLERYPLISHFIPADRLYGLPFLDPQWQPQSVLGPHEILPLLQFDALYNMAMQAGCQVVLSGMIGDALNNGSEEVYFDLIRRRCWAEVWRRFRLDWQRARWQTLRRFAWHGLVPLAPWALLRPLLVMRERRREMFCPLPACMSTSLQQRIRAMDETIRTARVRQHGVHCPAVRATLTALFPPPSGLTMPAMQAVERRHPYTDRRLIELVLAMPQACKWEHEQCGVLRAGRFHHRRALRHAVPDTVLVGNVGVDFTPVLQHNFVPATLHAWLLQHPVIHIFERNYVHPASFLTALQQATDLDDYVLALLNIEGWLRALAPGGAMHALLPSRPVASRM